MRGTLRVILTVLTAAALASGASAAYAAPADIIDDGAPGLLVIETNPDTFDVILDPGERDEWLLTVHSQAPTAGTLEMSFTSTGTLASTLDGVAVEIAQCSLGWAGTPGASSCGGAVTTHLALTPFAAVDPAATMSLGVVPAGAAIHLRVTVELDPAPPAELQGTDADFIITFRGVGAASVSTGDPGTIAHTGIDTEPLLGVTALALALGIVLIIVAAVRRRHTGGRS